MKTKNILLAALAAIGLVFTSCDDVNPPLDTSSNSSAYPSADTFTKGAAQVEPAKIVIEFHEGHSHLPNLDDGKGNEIPTVGAIGDVFWSKTQENSGFHENPDSRKAKYPHNTVQEMTLERQPDGSYKPTADSTDAFRMITSKRDGGNWHAFVVQFYDKDGNRTDLDLRKPEMQDRVQMFWTVSDIKPLYDGAPLEKDVKPTDLFFFMHFDRATDSSREVLKLPLGFRGVVKTAKAYAKYNVVLSLTILPEGKKKGTPLRNSVSPSEAQKKALALQFAIPCRNITYVLEDNGTIDPFAPNADELYEQEDRRYYGDLCREYPGYTEEEMIELYRQYFKLPVEGAEGSQFWL